MIATLAEVLGPALAGGYAVPGLVCLGWEDARAYVRAAEAERAPVILQAGPGARAHMPVAVWGAMFRALAEDASVPVVAHLDHGLTVGDAHAAIAAGFTSVMIDGSALPLEHNIRLTAEVVALAHAAGVSCEGELGVVGYAGGKASTGTDPEEAARFVCETGVDALAVSVGNVHLQTGAGQGLDLGLIRRIEAATSVPLVIHGGSGVPEDQRAALAAGSQIAKFNIGTELRMVFGAALREAVARDPARFDRIAILKDTEDPVMQAARAMFRGLGTSGRG
ncbi:class II fructose-bisphosphate aldolase [Rhodobacter sp. SY28-1]|uniref:class II fructose-bisphosphate aldolase n=1 Tax=Rhodobacter sp. SY28-1 TaxID=2562317 RepID=UPI0010C12E58|nr:class II fructose-bisphosphate aldolase [Rhodobacter sp. SY28-1]